MICSWGAMTRPVTLSKRQMRASLYGPASKRQLQLSLIQQRARDVIKHGGGETN
jgi:hypothetical protein